MLTLERPTDTYRARNPFPARLPQEWEALPGLEALLEAPASREPVYPFPVIERLSPRQGLLRSREVKLFTLELTRCAPVHFQAWAKADLDVYVLDPHGEMIAWDNHEGGRPCCEFKPSYRGEYLIKLVNNADRPVHYALYVS